MPVLGGIMPVLGGIMPVLGGIMLPAGDGFPEGGVASDGDVVGGQSD